MTISASENKLWSRILLVFFILSGIIATIPIFSMDYLVTLDGPNHLYTSRTFLELLCNEGFYSQYFHFNDSFTPNYFTVIILGGLQSIFSGMVALKIFHLLHVVLMVFSAYYWSNARSNKPANYPYLVFPFIYSFLFISGFYNFILGVSFGFITLGFFERIQLRSWKMKHYVIIGLLLILVYLSHIIPFFFIGLYIVIDLLVQWKRNDWNKADLKHFAMLLLVGSPGLILTLIFMTGKETTYGYLEMNELIAHITSGFSMVIKHETPDELTTINWIKLFYLGFTLMLFVFAYVQDTKKNMTMLVATIAVLFGYFVLPDSAGFASVFSVRIEYIFWLFVILGASRVQFKIITYQLIPAVFGLGLLIFQITTNLPYWKMLNGHAKSIITASSFIEDQSVVYPVFNSLYWDDYHISNFMGTVDKRVLVLENTSARQDYFPIIYNSPYEECLKTHAQREFNCTQQQIGIDYLLIVGKYVLDPNDTLATKLYAEAYSNGKVVYEDDLVQLLKFD